MADRDDVHGGDPYRGSAYREAAGRCPRCHGALQGNPTGVLTCPRTCGEWLGRAMLRGQVALENLAACEPDVGSLIDHPFPPATCALCTATMEVRLQQGVSFDLCLDHGVWLDRGEREDFEAVFGLSVAALRAMRAPPAPELARPHHEDLEQEARERRELAAWLESLAANRRA